MSAHQAPSGQAVLAARDPLDPAVVEQPYDYYAALHEHAPVRPVPDRGFVLVSRYEDIVGVLRRPQLFSADYRRLFNTRPEVAAELAKGAPPAAALATTDPPEHDRYRALVNKAFTGARVEAMVADVAAVAEELIDGFEADGRFEMVGQFAFPLTMRITARQLGLPERDLPRFREWSAARVAQFSQMLSADEEVSAARKRIEFQRYFTRLLAEKREHPSDDMISVLAGAQLDGLDRGLSIGELLGLVEQLMTAGNHTTTQAFASAALMLVTDAGLMAAAQADGARLRAFLEEALRLESPAAGVWRIATGDCEVGGVPVASGTGVHLRLAAGNRDRCRFADPEQVDLARESPRAHLAFGHGAHACIGMALARRELEVGFAALLARLPGLRLAAGAHDFGHLPSFMVRGLRELRLAFGEERAA